MTTESSNDGPRAEIVSATPAHVRELLAAGLCAEEVREIEAAGSTPAAVVERSFANSTKAWTFLDGQGATVAMWGVAPWPNQPGVGVPWLATTNDFRHYALVAHRRAAEFIREMGREFPILAGRAL